MSNLPVSIDFGDAPGDGNGEAIRSALIKLQLGINELDGGGGEFDAFRALMLRTTALSSALSLYVDPAASAEDVAAFNGRLFNTIAAARAAVVAMSGLGFKKQVRINLLPGSYGTQRIIGHPWTVWSSLDMSTVMFDDSSADGVVELSSAMTVDNLNIDGVENSAFWSFVGVDVKGVYIRGSLLSPWLGGNPIDPGRRKSLGVKLRGDFQTVFVDDVHDFDHATSASPIDLDGNGQDNDMHFGFRSRTFIDALFMVGGAVVKLNRCYGVNFWNSTIRARAELGCTPLEMTHFISGGSTLAPGESLAIYEGAAASGAPLRIGERCRLIVSGGSTVPGLDNASRGNVVFVRSGGRAETVAGLGRFTPVNQQTAVAFHDPTSCEMVWCSPGRAAGASLNVIEDTLSSAVLATSAWVTICSFTLTSPVRKAGHRAGISLRESSSGKAIFFGFRGDGDLVVEHLATLSSAPTTVATQVARGDRVALRILTTGGNRFYDMSVNGVRWEPLFAEPASTHLTPNLAGLAIDAANTATPNLGCGMSARDWFVGVLA